MESKGKEKGISNRAGLQNIEYVFINPTTVHLELSFGVPAASAARCPTSLSGVITAPVLQMHCRPQAGRNRFNSV